MTDFTVHTLESAPAASRSLLDGIQKTFGFIPNLFAVFAESPAALRGALAMGEAFAKSTLSAVEQQLVALAVSEANDCPFCVAAHSTIAKHMARADPALVAATRVRATLPDAKLDVLVTFVREVVEQRGFISDAHVARFLAAGYTKAHLLEVLLGVGMKTFNNYTDHIAHVPLNEQFEAGAWKPARREQALEHA
jgi:uncharacterized peroxidase-related enzyme